MQKVPPKPPSAWKSAKTKSDQFFGLFLHFLRFLWIFSQNYAQLFKAAIDYENLGPYASKTVCGFFLGQLVCLLQLLKHRQFGPFLAIFKIFCKFSLIFSTFCVFSQLLVDGFSNRFFVLNLEVCTHPKL